MIFAAREGFETHFPLLTVNVYSVDGFSPMNEAVNPEPSVVFPSGNLLIVHSD